MLLPTLPPPDSYKPREHTPDGEFCRRQISFRPAEFRAIKLYAEAHALRCNSAVISDLLRRAAESGWLPVELFPATYVCGSLGGPGVGPVVSISRKTQAPTVHLEVTGGPARVVVEGRHNSRNPWRLLHTGTEPGVFPVEWMPEMRMSVPVSGGATVRAVYRP